MEAEIGDRVMVGEIPRLLGIANAIRLGRNSAGHPKELANRRDQAHELMSAFPKFAATIVAATEALGAAAP